MTRRSIAAALAGLAFALTAAGCDSGPPPHELAIEGGERGAAMYFDPETPAVAAGRYEVTFDNVGAVSHELAFLDRAGAPVAARSTAGKTNVAIEVEFEPGTYRMVCREPGHEAAGMVGSLRVTG